MLAPAINLALALHRLEGAVIAPSPLRLSDRASGIHHHCGDSLSPTLTVPAPKRILDVQGLSCGSSGLTPGDLKAGHAMCADGSKIHED